MPDEPNAFAGLMSALAIIVVMIGFTAVAVGIGTITGSTLAGVLAWLAFMLTVGVCVVKAPD